MQSLEKKKICKVFLLLVVISLLVVVAGGNDQRAKNKGRINELSDIKEWKQLLKTKTNVLIYFALDGIQNMAKDIGKVLLDTNENIRGIGTIVTVDCTTKEGRKLCKKVKAESPSSSFILKHFHNGDFNKDYDRGMRVSSMVNFMKDPTGELPWEEDPTASGILHLQDPPALLRLVKKETKKGILVMFYAPWCGYCKKMKPDYVGAAEEVGDVAIVAAIDANRPANNELRTKYNITGFPTLLYFRNGGLKQHYEGENTKDAIVSFLRDPDAPPVLKPKEVEWSEEPSQVVHLTTETFHQFIQENPSVLVMFYAPWCGHCKRMKPDYAAAAEQLKELGIEGILAAVDVTRQTDLGKKYDIKGYPTLKYFRQGTFAFNTENLREKETLIEFMKDPREPPPPPPPEKPWSEEVTAVVHLEEETFERMLVDKAHALIMFYAPWCGHCKQAKPEFTSAAEDLKDEENILFGAVDCTVEISLCKTYGVKGYPTFKHFRHFNQGKVTSYDGGRTRQDFSNEVNADATGSTNKAFYPDWAGIQGQEHVHKLTDENIAQFIQKQESALVMFYAPWCGHCKTMKPDYARAAMALAKDSPKSVLAALDCIQYPHVMERYKINGYPTLKYYRNGNFVTDYNGHRRTTEFINFMMRGPKGRDEL